MQCQPQQCGNIFKVNDDDPRMAIFTVCSALISRGTKARKNVKRYPKSNKNNREA